VKGLTGRGLGNRGTIPRSFALENTWEKKDDWAENSSGGENRDCEKNPEIGSPVQYVNYRRNTNHGRELYQYWEFLT